MSPITKKESNSSTYTKVSTLTELKAALSSAKKGDTVFIMGNAEIKVTEKLIIPEGVTLASNRGQAVSNVNGTHVSDGFSLGAYYT